MEEDGGKARVLPDQESVFRVLKHCQPRSELQSCERAGERQPSKLVYQKLGSNFRISFHLGPIMTLGKGETIQGRWKLIEKLGAGGFGEVYSAADVDSDDIVAVKIEKEGHRSGEGIRAGGLYYEQKVYGCLNATELPVSGVVRKRWFGNERGNIVLLMDCLGPSLHDRLNKCGGNLSLKSVLMIGIQTLRRPRFVHQRSFVHGDLKPTNLLTGMRKLSGTVYLADFGMASPYRDHYTKRHISYRTGKSVYLSAALQCSLPLMAAKGTRFLEETTSNHWYMFSYTSSEGLYPGKRFSRLRWREKRST